VQNLRNSLSDFSQKKRGVLREAERQRSVLGSYANVRSKGFEVLIRKRQCLMLESGTTGEVRFVNQLFRLAA
jgi:hypothetical protein